MNDLDLRDQKNLASFLTALLKGRSEIDARALLNAHQVNYRMGDGMGTCDYCVYRLNIGLADGKVTEVNFG